MAMGTEAAGEVAGNTAGGRVAESIVCASGKEWPVLGSAGADAALVTSVFDGLAIDSTSPQTAQKRFEPGGDKAFTSGCHWCPSEQSNGVATARSPSCSGIG
jgi:hypothetical protein